MIAALLVLAGFHFSDPTNTLGKSEAQVLAMGREGWTSYYTANAAESTEKKNIYQACETYIAAAARRNARLLAAPHLANREKKKQLAGLVVEFARTTFSVYALTDSYSWMGKVGLVLDADAQDAIYAYLRPAAQKRAKPMVVSDVRKRLARWEVEIKINRREVSSGRLNEAARDLAKAEKLYRDIVPLIAATTGRAGSDRILSFCKEAAEVSSNF